MFNIIILYISLLFFVSATVLQAQQDSTVHSNLTKKEIRNLKRKQFKQDGERLFLRLNNVFANLNTTFSFNKENSIVSIKYGLEDNLGLASNRSFLNTIFYYRFTPRSGIIAQYYGINRSRSSISKSEIVFLSDTLS
ncbi:hypothetical protein OO013_08205 [Mangrovivirga sp. M17]|uniref:Uncharacterized protein n=1 Tax=Mangrovivirga halotolerans TaxID=2993936 RepID=A0ABT3RR35_9BACT|nr:hypothetical protein [Mangrovivirga halotolerans]MCX2743844.1 hypothetical protein [Mangrovivirga halotolerans]